MITIDLTKIIKSSIYLSTYVGHAAAALRPYTGQLDAIA